MVTPLVQDATGKPRVTIRPSVEKAFTSKEVEMGFYFNVPEPYTVLLCHEVATPVVEGAPELKPLFSAFCPTFLKLDPDERMGCRFRYGFEEKAQADKAQAIQGKLRLILREAGTLTPAVPLAVGKTTRVCVDGNRVQLRTRRLSDSCGIQQYIEVHVQAETPLYKVLFFEAGQEESPLLGRVADTFAKLENGEFQMGRHTEATFYLYCPGRDLSVRLQAISGPVHAQLLPFRIPVK